nr:AMP-binding protein [Sphingobium sp. Sx8-8]
MSVEVIRCGAAALDRATLDANVARITGGLEKLGITQGDRVALLLKNSIAFVEISLAIGRLGAFPVPINWHFAAVEIDVLLKDCDPAAIFVHEDLGASLPESWKQDRRTMFVGADDAPSPYASWRDGSDLFNGPDRQAPGSIVYTSGTTGRPKGVKRCPPTPEQQASMRAIRSDLYRMDASSRVLVPGPLYHAFPNQFAIHGVLTAEYTEIMPRFDAEAMLATIQRERITSVALAPIMFVRLLRLPAETRQACDLSSLRWALHAGGPCADDVKRAMIDWWGPIVAEYYGGTEVGALTLCSSAEWLDRPGTCGKPLEDVEFRIVDAEGVDVARGEAGEIFGRLRSYPDFTYHNDPAKRAEVGLGDLVSLGDIGYQDEDGYLFLCDRARDMVVSGGVNIYPAEVEKALFAIPGVADCAAFGVPDPEFGEMIVAFVVGDNLDADGLRKRLRETIAGYKVPKLIRQVETLHRDASGKIRKHVLRDQFLAASGVQAPAQAPHSR